MVVYGKAVVYVEWSYNRGRSYKSGTIVVDKSRGGEVPQENYVTGKVGQYAYPSLSLVGMPTAT